MLAIVLTSDSKFIIYSIVSDVGCGRYYGDGSFVDSDEVWLMLNLL